jgi:signal transduction protein with GAF and PtsI domain
VDDVTRDEAVCAAVRREMRQRGYDDHAADDAVFEEGVADIAKAAVDALIAAGWGDLTAERERLAAAVEAARCDDEGCADYRDGLDAAARLIRTTTEEADRG